MPGPRVIEVETAWRTARKSRTVVRNLVRAGIGDKGAMLTSGTRGRFDRYDIVDERDIVEAGRKMGLYMAAVEKERAKKARTIPPAGENTKSDKGVLIQ